MFIFPKVEELNTPDFPELLIKIQFVARGIIHKVLVIIFYYSNLIYTDIFITFLILTKAFSVNSQAVVWTFLCELLRFSERKAGHCLTKYRLEFDPWNLIQLATEVIPSVPFLSLPVELWKFVRQWLKLLCKKACQWTIY